MPDSRPTPTPGTPAVLFVCVHNAGRSQMAAGYLTALAGDRVEVFSAGSEPAESVNPAAIRRWPTTASTSHPVRRRS